MKSDESSGIISIRRKEKCLKLNINHINEDLTEFLKMDGKVVEMQNSLPELDKQKENHFKSNDKLILLLQEDEVDAECERSLSSIIVQFVSYTARLKGILQTHVTLPYLQM